MSGKITRELEQAMTAHRQGELARAAALYRDILAADPKHIEALQLLGVVARQMDKPALALQLIDQALTLNPKHPGALANKALLLREQQDYAGAMTCVRAALAIDPRNLEANSNLGGLLFSTGDFAAAATAYRDALRYHPDQAELHQGLAASLLKLGDLPGAYHAVKLALSHKPRAAYIHNTLGQILQGAGHYPEAIAAFRQAHTLDLNLRDAMVSEAMLHLLLGDFAAGFALYAQRNVDEPRYHGIPFWHGEALDGTLLLRVEQGFGDTLQFIRYLPRLQVLAKNLVVEVQAEVLELCRSLAPKLTWLSPKQPLPPVVRQIRLLDLPPLFGTDLASVPAKIPYLHADAARQKQWQEKTAAQPKPRIGLVWAGNPKHLNDLNRSVSLLALQTLFEQHADHLVLLQKGFDTTALCAQYPGLYDGGNQCNDFGDTAALISTLDLVVTVDTAVAHLAGALGKPVWVLLPFNPDWRWLLAREDSPWYPTARLFRQTTPRDWQPVVARVVTEIQRLRQGDQAVLAPTGAGQMPQLVLLEQP